VTFLYAFSSVRNLKRNITESSIVFVGENTPFITHENVSKLLIQNNQDVTSVPKEILDLNDLESALNSNPMIKHAEVYVAVNGVLTAEIIQKKPIARVNTNASYYIDDEGSFMPLSSNFTARVPLVTGAIRKDRLKQVHEVALMVQEDEFLKKHVIEIRQDESEELSLKLRQCDFDVSLGKAKELNKKINNLKAFYQKALKDKTLNSYRNVNLRFGNQVVCTKK
jgi:cell division protein FtsQ